MRWCKKIKEKQQFLAVARAYPLKLPVFAKKLGQS
jgi:hypothetical protein